MMRIVHVIGFFQPEYGYEEYYTALNQLKLGYDVHVITSDRIVNVPSRPLNERIKGVGTFIENGITVHRLPVLLDKFNDFVVTWGVSRKLKELKPDVVHCHGARQLGQYVASRMKKKMGYRLVVDHHDFFYPGHFLFPMEKTFKKVLSKIEYMTFRRMLGFYIFYKSDKVVAIEEVCKKHLIEYFYVNAEKIYVNNLGVDIERYKRSKAGRRRVRRKYKISENTTVLGFVGLFTRRKKVELYIQLIGMLQELDVVLMMVGGYDSGYETTINKIILDKNLKDKVIMTGNVSQESIVDYISATDVGIYLANSSVIWLEMMACGIPLVAPRDMQFSHLLQSNSRQIEYGNVKEAKNEIEYLITHKDLINIMGKKSLSIVRSSYSYSSITKSLVKQYF